MPLLRFAAAAAALHAILARRCRRARGRHYAVDADYVAIVLLRFRHAMLMSCYARLLLVC